MSGEKIAVVLFNLGGPDCAQAIAPFLFNFFTDPNIIRVPAPFRWMIARLIAFRRSRREAGSSYARLGGKSPLLENTKAQADALEALLSRSGRKFQVFIAMRYWHPLTTETVSKIKASGADRVVLLPLYPQYSTTTTRSSLQEWQKAYRDARLEIPVSMICCYPWEVGFIEASARLIRETHAKALQESGRWPRVLFSAHGLPESIIAEGDPYQWQCEQSAQKIASATGIERLDWQICYQSRVGPKKWIGPSTEDALRQAALDRVPVVIYPHAFVSEHVETLVEIEHEYRGLADTLGVPWFGRVPTVATDPLFIQGLAHMIDAALARGGLSSASGERLCPKEFSQCCQQQFGQKV